MKRIVSVIIAMAVLMSCVAGIAEEKKSVKDECKKNLGLIYLAYKLNPEETGRDKLIFGYQNLIMYIIHDASDMFYAYYGIKGGDSNAVAESVIPGEKGSSAMIKLATDTYISWLDGKMTDSEYGEVLMEMIGALIGLSD